MICTFYTSSVNSTATVPTFDPSIFPWKLTYSSIYVLVEMRCQPAPDKPKKFRPECSINKPPVRPKQQGEGVNYYHLPWQTWWWTIILPRDQNQPKYAGCPLIHKQETWSAWYTSSYSFGFCSFFFSSISCSYYFLSFPHFFLHLLLLFPQYFF